MEIRLKREDYKDTDDLKSLVELQNIVYKGKHQFSAQNFKFWYIDNPPGPAYSFSAYDGSQMVANVSFFQTTINLDGKILHGLHSMGVVTHPDYQGLGLFKKLGQMGCECAKNDGLDFMMAISNANSTPGFLKHMGFYLISPLEVKWGWGKIIPQVNQKRFFKVYDLQTIQWRLIDPKYSLNKNKVYGFHGIKFGIKTYMGHLDQRLITGLEIPQKRNLIRPLNLYIGLGSDLTKGHYFNFPKFVKHSPFNLIFKDLKGTLKTISKEDVFFQLVDFDVT